MLQKLTTKPSKLITLSLRYSSSTSGKVMHDKLLMASFIHAKQLGFNDEAITAACHDFQLPPVSGCILKNGPYDIV